jgi:hypothetical protein
MIFQAKLHRFCGISQCLTPGHTHWGGFLEALQNIINATKLSRPVQLHGSVVRRWFHPHGLMFHGKSD